MTSVVVFVVVSGIKGDRRRRQDKAGDKRRRDIVAVQSGTEGRPRSLQRDAQEPQGFRHGPHQRDRTGQAGFTRGTSRRLQDYSGVVHPRVETTKGKLIYRLFGRYIALN